MSICTVIRKIFQLYLLFLLSLNVVAKRKGGFDDSGMPTYGHWCADLKNQSKTPLKYLYYQCLPYIIGLASATDGFQNEGSYLIDLIEIPDKSIFTVNITGLTVLTFSILDSSGLAAETNLEFNLTWTDYRLKWVPSEWYFEQYPIQLKPLEHIWAPILKIQGVSSVLSQPVDYYNTNVKHDGSVNLTAVSELKLRKCSIDLSIYPYDELECCANVDLEPSNKINLDTVQLKADWDKSIISIWKIQEVIIRADDGKNVKICIKAQRNRGLINVELTLPMAVSAMVLICAIFAVHWNMQIYVKLVALIIQMLSFQNLVAKGEVSGSNSIPTIYVFYNFTTIMTVISLFETVILWSISSRSFSAPPPHRVSLIAQVGSKWTLNTSKKADGDENDWASFFRILHDFFSTMIIIVFIIGLIVIYATG